MRLFLICLLALVAITGCKKGNNSEAEAEGGASTATNNEGTASGTTPAAGDVAGTWNITEAASPNGDAYTGKVTFRKLMDNVYAINWQTSAGDYPGVGILEGNNLFIGWGIDADHGVAVYTQNGNKLMGRWTSSPLNGASGTENVTLAGGNLVGNHTATGTNPGTSTEYESQLAITQNGSVYTFKWTGTSVSYSGVGLKVGNTVAVGWGMGPNHGIVHYTLNGNAAQGKWAVPGMNTTAIENIGR